MNDTELDELLNRWDVPLASAELPGKVWRAFRPPRRPRFWGFDWKPMFAGTALGAGLCLFLLITQAFPQTLRVGSPLFHIPFTVDTEFVYYDAAGTPKVERYTTAYLDDNGQPVILSTSYPDRPFFNAFRRVLDFKDFIWRQYADRRPGGPLFVHDCRPSGPVVEWTSILGHRTFAIDITPPAVDKYRVTLWEASDLCFVMKMRNEERQPDGSYRTTFEQRATAVTRTGGQQSSQ